MAAGRFIRSSRDVRHLAGGGRASKIDLVTVKERLLEDLAGELGECQPARLRAMYQERGSADPLTDAGAGAWSELIPESAGGD
jgi:hypothetical protein